jgi:hypothetical protein
MDRIAQLVREADANQPSPPLCSDLAQRVRHRRARRRAVRRGVALALLLIIGGLTFRLFNAPPPPIATAPPDTAQLLMQCARLESDAALHERVAELIMSSERPGKGRYTLPHPTPADDPSAAQLERSALILLRRGGRLLEDPQTHDQAVDLYRQIVRLFPRTRGGQAAQKALNEINFNSAPSRKEQS